MEEDKFQKACVDLIDHASKHNGAIIPSKFHKICKKYGIQEIELYQYIKTNQVII